MEECRNGRVMRRSNCAALLTRFLLPSSLLQFIYVGNQTSSGRNYLEEESLIIIQCKRLDKKRKKKIQELPFSIGPVNVFFYLQVKMSAQFI